MSRLVRKQIYLSKQQKDLLNRLAEVAGVSESELVRQAIERQFGSRRLSPVRRDPVAWDEALRFMRDIQARRLSAGRVRDWMREDLYDAR